MSLIAKVALNLPIDEAFDYSVPQDLRDHAVVGSYVSVPFGARVLSGYVVQLVPPGERANLKPIKKVLEFSGFDETDLGFAERFCAHYGCSLGEALAVMMRHRSLPPVAKPSAPPVTTELFHVPPGSYHKVLQELIRQHPDYHIVVPDGFMAEALGLSSEQRARCGLRSSVFQALARRCFLIVIDDENASYKQEQSPMYETRDVILMGASIYGVSVAFVGHTPSVELMHLAAEKKISYQGSGMPSGRVSVVDLTNYKFLEKGLLSVPARCALEEDLAAKATSIVVLNRKGSYRVTRCAGCGHLLQCPHCASALTYMRSRKEFVCPHCSYVTADAGLCPSCGKPGWKSYGVGIEQVQKELGGLFPHARIGVFQREDKVLPRAIDILITTQAVLRFRNSLRANTVVLVDFDAELNRLDMRSSFKAWSLAGHLQGLAGRMLLQTRNPGHFVIEALVKNDPGLFYRAHMQVLKELRFSPFYHWVEVVVRGKLMVPAQSLIEELQQRLNSMKAASMALTPAAPAVPPKLRDQFRFRLSLGANQVEEAVALIKQSLQSIKRQRQLIVTLNVDP